VHRLQPPDRPGALPVALYNLGLLAASPILVLYALWRLVILGKARGGWWERLGFVRVPPAGERLRVWVHAVSAGEVVAASPIVRAIASLDQSASIVLSTTTPAGKDMAAAKCPQAEAAFYFPLDLLPSVTRAIKSVRPQVCVLLESELWPNFLAACARARIPAVVVNGRVSDRTWIRAALARPILSWAVRNVSCFAMQSQRDALRVTALGAESSRVSVCGNVKFDQEIPPLSPHEKQELMRGLGLQDGELVIVAGSTHPGEEEQLARAFRRVKECFPQARLILAPRHIARAAQALQSMVNLGFQARRRTEGPAGAGEVIVLDTMGELARIYGLAEVAFVGGSLAPVGGHDILQPLAHGAPVFFGPHMFKQRDSAELALQSGVGFQVKDAEELARGMRELLAAPEKMGKIRAACRQLIERHRGTSRRCAEIVLALAAGAPR
jgi:3-deoxy-D-manno-octulosonic-acid transferase